MLSTIYGAVAARRRRYYERHGDARRRLARPVVSVGALAAGGRGKTPTTAFLAELLRDAGERPAILSRGYGRRTVADGVVVVRTADRIVADTDVAGDEPRMLAEHLNVAVLVAEDRYLAGRMAETAFGATVHLLDDGYQHLTLERDVNLLLIDPDDPDHRTLPFGPLRERPEAARCADALIVDTPDDAIAAAAAARLGAGTWFRLDRSIGAPRPIGPGAGAAADDTLPRPGDRVLVAAGIAAPERFAAALGDAGYDVAGVVPFRDHHRFTRGSLRQIAGRAAAAGVDSVLTTEKDAVRLAALAPFPVRLAAVPLVASVEPREAFRGWLLDRVAAAAARAEPTARGDRAERTARAVQTARPAGDPR